MDYKKLSRIADSVKRLEESKEKPEFNDVQECIDWWGIGNVSEEYAEVEYWDEESADAVYTDMNTGEEATLRMEGLYKSEEEAHDALIEDMKKFGYEETDCDDWEGIYKAWFKKLNQKDSFKVQDSDGATWVSPEGVIELLQEEIPEIEWELWENAEGENAATAAYDVEDVNDLLKRVKRVLHKEWPNAYFEFDTESDEHSLYVQ